MWIQGNWDDGNKQNEQNGHLLQRRRLDLMDVKLKVAARDPMVMDPGQLRQAG